MKTAQTVKSIQKSISSNINKGISSGIGSGNRTITTTHTQVILGPCALHIGLWHSSEVKEFGKKTILGEKFDYLEKFIL